MKTVNLELSKQLKEAGYTQKSYFMWDDDGSLRVGINGAQAPHHKTAYSEELEIEADECFASPIAEEILDKMIFVKSWKSTDGYFYCEKIIEIVDFDYQTSDKVLANAAAKMWLYLKKEDLI